MHHLWKLQPAVLLLDLAPIVARSLAFCGEGPQCASWPTIRLLSTDSNDDMTENTSLLIVILSYIRNRTYARNWTYPRDSNDYFSATKAGWATDHYSISATVLGLLLLAVYLSRPGPNWYWIVDSIWHWLLAAWMTQFTNNKHYSLLLFVLLSAIAVLFHSSVVAVSLEVSRSQFA